ncbi:MAG: phosphate ABC transporter substrate-binding protein [Opitutaceae bacterium]|nr:phosphate ABC transporter substrate-binding protein [Verrucomicrobiales bacterium]
MNSLSKPEIRRKFVLLSRAASGLMLCSALVHGSGCSRETSSAKGRESDTGKPRQREKLLVTGSSTMAPLVEEIARHFQALHTNVEVTVKMGGSGRGIQDVREGISEIGMASRALTESEADLLGLPIARDGICLLVNSANPVRSLTDAQVSAVYTGATTNWKAVGGLDAPIFVVTRTEGRSELELFLHYFKINKTAVKAHSSAGDNLTGIQAVSTNRDAIAFLSVGEAERNAKAGAPIRLLPTAGVVASSQNIRTGTYPLSRPLTLVTKGVPKGAVAEFLDYCLLPRIGELIRRHEFVPFLD